MSTKTSQSKNNKKGINNVICAILAFIIGFVGTFAGYFFVEAPKDEQVSVIASGELSFHFLELGNNYTGDSVYVKVGDVDVLIDAGSRPNSAPVIKSYVDQYCTDGTLEYVIATHAHQDHIAGFAGNGTYDSIFDMYVCEVIIDFSLHNTNSATYNRYVTERDQEVANGATHYTSTDLIPNVDAENYQFVLDEESGVTMTLLKQKYYFEETEDENDYSLCIMFSHGERNFLFTGDLEAHGEESLALLNDLPHVDLFKAGHHGSKTSSNDCLLDEITPEIVCVCCCAGAVEYTQNLENTFPTQAFIDRIAKHTENVYVTTVGIVSWNQSKNKYVDDGFQSLNGTIIVTSNKDGVVVVCSNVDTKLKDTDWFKNNRTCPEDWE
ncbi:MAG: MBL fold metallo-hydrolase [Clostridia bacterium]|nr:MBL fold metallo-hydrolase [Clostridia bacterium]